MAKCSKDYEPAIEVFQKALTEHRNPDTLKKLNEAQKAKKDLEQQEYFDPKLADEEREKGILLFWFACLLFIERSAVSYVFTAIINMQVMNSSRSKIILRLWSITQSL